MCFHTPCPSRSCSAAELEKTLEGKPGSTYNLSRLKHFGDLSSNLLSPQAAIVNESLIEFSHE